MNELKPETKGKLTIDELLNSTELKEESAAKELLTTENLTAKSELDDNQVLGFAKLSLLASMFKLPEVETFKRNFMELQISRKRKGRSEFVDSLKSTLGEKQKMGNPFAGLWK